MAYAYRRGACCASCARGGRCQGALGLGDDAASSGPGGTLLPPAPAPAADLNSMVQDIRDHAARYVDQDRQLRYMQMGVTLMIPLAAALWKFILGRRQSTPIL